MHIGVMISSTYKQLIAITKSMVVGSMNLMEFLANYCTLDDQPTLTECIRFQGRERKINIPQEISIKYRDFGVLLLDDRTGARLEALEHEHRCNAEHINSKILQEWIAGKGKHPVSWKTLTEVLRDVELNTLAEDIDHVKCS